MNFEFKAFLFENLEAAGSIAGYVSISIIGFALFTLYAKKRHKSFVIQTKKNNIWRFISHIH